MSLNMPVERTDDTDRRMTSKEREAPMTSNAIGRERLPKISSILPLIQRFNVLDHMLDLETTHIDFVFGKRIKHERVVRVGAVADSY